MSSGATYQYQHKITPDSASSINSELDMFGIPPTQTQIIEGMYEVLEATDYSLQSNQVKFIIGEDDRHFMDLSESFVELELKVTKAGGAAIPGNVDNVLHYLEDNIAHSVFGKASLHVNSLLAEYQDKYAEKAYIENLVNTSKSVKETSLELEGWIEDSGRGQNHAEIEDEDFIARKGIIAGSKTISYCFTPKLSLFQQDKLIPPSTSLTLLFEKAITKKMLRAATNNPDGGAKVLITSAKFHLRKCKLDEAAQLAIVKRWVGFKGPSGKLSAGVPIKYTHKKAHIQSHTLSAGSRNHGITITSVRRPSRLYCALLDDDAAAGSFTKSAFHFKHANVGKLSLKEDGKVVGEEFTPDFATGKVAREYQSFLQACGKQHFGSSNGVTIKNFASGGATLFGWDLSRGLTNQLEPIQDVQLRLNFIFDNALATTTNLLVYMEVDEHIELSRGQQPVIV